MSIQTKKNEQVISLHNEWYQKIRSQQIREAKQLEEKINKNIDEIEKDQELLLYHALLKFRYKLLTDGENINQDYFEKVESLYTVKNNFLDYYYHFFRAINYTLCKNNDKALESYEKAEELLKYVPDKLEKAEFNYRISSFYLHTYQPLPAIKYVSKAKKIFSENPGYENNVAACENILGAACIDIKQFQQAEVSFNSAIDILRKQNEDILILRVRNNLGLLYASQNLSALAIRHLSEVNQKIPNHYKAIFLEAREHFKLGETNIAKEMIERGLNICSQMKNEEYQHHFAILDKLNRNTPSEELEGTILNAVDYFNKKQLYNYTQEYMGILAVKFYEDDNHSKASKYFYVSHEAKNKKFEKGALK